MWGVFLLCAHADFLELQGDPGSACVFSAPVLGLAVSQEPWVLLLDKDIRNQELGLRWAHCSCRKIDLCRATCTHAHLPTLLRGTPSSTRDSVYVQVCVCLFFYHLFYKLYLIPKWHVRVVFSNSIQWGCFIYFNMVNGGLPFVGFYFCHILHSFRISQL